MKLLFFFSSFFFLLLSIVTVESLIIIPFRLLLKCSFCLLWSAILLQCLYCEFLFIYLAWVLMNLLDLRNCDINSGKFLVIILQMSPLPHSHYYFLLEMITIRSYYSILHVPCMFFYPFVFLFHILYNFCCSNGKFSEVFDV